MSRNTPPAAGGEIFSRDPAHCNFAFSRRLGAEGSFYSAKLRVIVCETCGHVELYAESHRDLCSWLKSDEAGGRGGDSSKAKQLRSLAAGAGIVPAQLLMTAHG